MVIFSVVLSPWVNIFKQLTDGIQILVNVLQRIRMLVLFMDEVSKV